MTIHPPDWLLTPISFPRIGTNGKPWGTGTEMNRRAAVTNEPWDDHCVVTPMIGGYRVMLEMRKVLEELIKAARAKNDPGNCGHVYIADWRLNPLRDLSDANPWGTGPWYPGVWATQTPPAKLDQTAIGLILRLMQAGVLVRILVWLPTPIQCDLGHLTSHIADHRFLWRVVQAESDRLQKHWNLAIPPGIVGLDARTAEGSTAGSHHQKMMVIRSDLPPTEIVPSFNVAFCGGVDLAFTRRDAPVDPTNYGQDEFLGGDWQSGSGIPGTGAHFVNPASAQANASAMMLWPPQDGGTDYSSLIGVPLPSVASKSDLPMQTDDDKDVCAAVGGIWDGSKVPPTCTYVLYTLGPDDKVLRDASDYPVGTQTTTPSVIYSKTNQVWHDQHLMLRGPIVSTLEWQFAERWRDPETPDAALEVHVANVVKDQYRGKVRFSTDAASDQKGNIVPLPTPKHEPPISNATATSIVQMWRTIPMRNSRAMSGSDLFLDGEFTVMRGYSQAISRATALIWIFDQYFWSEAVARLLNQRLRQCATLCVIVVLPPFADDNYPEIHLARTLALHELMKGLTGDMKARVGIYDLWQPVDGSRTNGHGTYVHAKAQTYDGALLVCGSANLNRRSLLCDSELACAVLDPAVVKQHQQNLWHLLFAKVPESAGKWPDLDLNSPNNGLAFFRDFQKAASNANACLIGDPWLDEIYSIDPEGLPAGIGGVDPVVLPNGLDRRSVIPGPLAGPVFEAKYAIGLDPSSLARSVEQDVIDKLDTAPRPPRLDDLTKRVDEQVQVRPDPSKPNEALMYTYRKQGELVTGSAVTWPAIVYTEGIRSYQFTENAEWWKQVCLSFPCFNAPPLYWPGYATSVVEFDLTPQHHVVVQLWKGWCARGGLAELTNVVAGQTIDVRGMPGGVGAEVGLYHRIPSKPFPKWLAHQLGPYGLALQLAFPKQVDWWWPYPEINPTISFTLTNGQTNQDFFKCAPEQTWWACKWMTAPDSYTRYRDDCQGQAPELTLESLRTLLGSSPIVDSFKLSWTVKCTIDGHTYTKTGVW
jgi:hypothetical protein